MSLEILNNKGVFEIHGNLIKENKDQVFEFFNTLLDTYYEIVICLKKVKQIDDSGLKVMRFIQNKANKRSKILFVLGKENRRIFKKFKEVRLNDIFENDYSK